MKSSLAGKLSVWLIREVWQQRIGLRYNARTNTVCRFYPSCSNYAIITLEKYGLIQGINLVLGRLKRCNQSNTDSTIDFP
jgi:putative component of membrane protein insertase Oxa1/YidC/SpoIIIJ protein YidD